MYLLDTNIISAISPRVRHPAEEAIAKWIEGNSQRLHLSVVTVVEIEDGIARAVRSGAARRARDLAEWLEALLHYYRNRILPVDLEIARIAGKLMDQARAAGIDPGFEDVAIAATAKRHALTVLTRNVKDFAPLSVTLLNPFEQIPLN
jgi:toxin FitB